MALCLNAQNFYMMAAESGWLYCQQVVGGVRSATMVAYNPVLHRHWRLRHDGVTDTMRFETSADRVTWTVQRTAARQMGITGLRVELSAGTWEPVGAPGTAIFDSFQLQ
jgi:hypothetical protein